MKPATSLRLIKIIHSAVWAVFATCIVLVPVFSYLGNLRVATLLLGVVLVEVVVLALNRWSCPLTGVAAKYTDDRADNFDIYLPLWLARYNKEVFGTLYVLGAIYTAMQWLSGRASF